MPVLKRIAPVAVSLAIIFAVTAVLFYLKDAHEGAQHLIFFCLLPTAFVAMISSISRASALTACYLLFHWNAPMAAATGTATIRPANPNR
jgi:hypothetical protein